MVDLEASADTRWAYELARQNALPSTIAAACGHTPRWARRLIEASGGTPRRFVPINRQRAFLRDPARRAHTHIVLRVHFSMTGDRRDAERLARINRAYRAIARPAIFTVDEIYHLLNGVVAECEVEVRTCAECEQQWYQIATSAFACPACEAYSLCVCKECKQPIYDESEGIFAPRRGRPPSYCAKCNPRQRRRRRQRRQAAEARGHSAQLELLDSAPRR